MSERLDVRLTEEEKERLSELAKQKNLSMTDLVRMWITRGDVVHVLAEQLQDFVSDFNKWHMGDTTASMHYLCRTLRSRPITDPSTREIMFGWMELFDRSFDLLAKDAARLQVELNKFVNNREAKDKTILVETILNFSDIVYAYNSIFVQSFLKIVNNMDESGRNEVGRLYSNDFRTRYNELASKYEDFLKRAQRELGQGLERDMPRAGEFRSKG